jgi:L-rhamnose-H+ transport protein
LNNGLAIGLAALLAGGVFQGSVLVLTRRWAWENTWLCFSAMAYLLAPWVLALWLAPDFPSMLDHVPGRAILNTVLFSIGWGIGALSMGISFRYLGMAITYAIVLGIGSTIGTLVPLAVLQRDKLMTPLGFSVMAGVVLAIIGTLVVSWAAWYRDNRDKAGEQAKEHRPANALLIGLPLCIGAGVLSSFGNLGFAFGSQISQNALDLGSSVLVAGAAVWAVLVPPVLVCNFAYSVYLLRRNHSLKFFRTPHTAGYFGLAVLMGVLWMGGMAAYGAGALAMGKLGRPSDGLYSCLP